MSRITDSVTDKLSNQISIVWKLSIPAILTQITAIVMQYIDSAMVGSLGENASAAIGLVSTSTWFIGGMGSAIAVGFSVQVAQYIGAGNPEDARRVVKHGMVTAAITGLILMALGIAIFKPLPGWLGGDKILWKDAGAYFLVFSLALPFRQINLLTSAFLQCSGNMVVPSVLNSVMCGLDVVFNLFFIPRYGVLGAAIGTGLAIFVVACLMSWFCCVRSELLRIDFREPCPLDRSILKRMLRIGVPVGAEAMAISGAMVVSTTIIAPLGSVAIAAHSFAVTAENVCYMVGHGVSSAATTLVGQSIGARKYPLARRYAAITVIFGASLMTFNGMIMYVACPLVFKILTPVVEVQLLATRVLRIELLAEPLYGVSMVASGALRGAEDTLIPSILNLFSIWVVRLGISVALVDTMGLPGVWVAMAVELSVRGLLLLARLLTSKYLKGDRSESGRGGRSESE